MSGGDVVVPGHWNPTSGFFPTLCTLKERDEGLSCKNHVTKQDKIIKQNKSTLFVDHVSRSR